MSKCKKKKKNCSTLFASNAHMLFQHRSRLSRTQTHNLGLLLLTWRSNQIHDKVWMTLLIHFSNFNGEAIEVWKWTSNFILQFTGHVITYPRHLACSQLDRRSFQSTDGWTHWPYICYVIGLSQHGFE